MTARRPPRTVVGFRCLDCAAEQAADRPEMTCITCGGNLDIVWDMPEVGRLVDPARLDRSTDSSLWRFRHLLPLHGDVDPLPVRVGGTPLYGGGALGARLGMEELFLKDDTVNPSSSFKDRASLVAALRARESGVETVACASTGNAAASLAGITSALGMKSIIFVPENAPRPKLTQILICGARIFLIKGSYDDAFELCEKSAARFGWYSRSTGVNPYTVEGKKTAAFEIAQALGWEPPDWVVVPTGDGNILGGIGKGFLQMRELGWIDRLPQLLAVQAEGASPIVTAFQAGSAIKPVAASTVADSISVGHPRDGTRALSMLRETEGRAVAVTDESILKAVGSLARDRGIFAEPSAAAALAGLEKSLADGTIETSERVVLLITGHGLKDVATASTLVEPPPAVEADLEAIARLLGSG